MARLDLPDKFRDEDMTERRKTSRRRFFLGGRRKHDNQLVDKRTLYDQLDRELSPRSSAEEHHFPKV